MTVAYEDNTNEITDEVGIVANMEEENKKGCGKIIRGNICGEEDYLCNECKEKGCWKEELKDAFAHLRTDEMTTEKPLSEKATREILPKGRYDYNFKYKDVSEAVNRLKEEIKTEGLTKDREEAVLFDIKEIFGDLGGKDEKTL